ncbi:hypothetical protein HY449_04905 [Candidatus Pacearchaeota archaeon]|nr:hypothetical protein [Candidatus Pacearchaeota archaeon]
MPIDFDLDVLEDDEWPPLGFSAIPRSYRAMTPLDLRGVRIFDDEQTGKRQEDFSERERPHYVWSKR